MTEKQPFSAKEHLTDVRGKQYLETKWRLVWLRSEHPDATIETQLIESATDFALFKATVTIPGGGSATGHGSETRQDWRDYIEKAETKAIGRALAALGYGTQFSDLEEGGIVDSPAQKPANQRSAQPVGSSGKSRDTHCADCGVAIEAAAVQGKQFSAADIVANARKHFNVPLCLPCYQERRRAQAKQSAAKGATNAKPA